MFIKVIEELKERHQSFDKDFNQVRSRFKRLKGEAKSFAQRKKNLSGVMYKAPAQYVSMLLPYFEQTDRCDLS